MYRLLVPRHYKVQKNETKPLPKQSRFIHRCLYRFLCHLSVYLLQRCWLSPDSMMYASTATNIQAHGSLSPLIKHPITFFPVFYPFFFGVIQFISRVDPIEAGAMINGFLFAAVVFTSGWIMEKFHSRIRVSINGSYLAAIILSPGLLEIYTFLWSETLFILEILFFIIAYWRYWQTHTHQSLDYGGCYNRYQLVLPGMRVLPLLAPADCCYCWIMSYRSGKK